LWAIICYFLATLHPKTLFSMSAFCVKSSSSSRSFWSVFIENVRAEIFFWVLSLILDPTHSLRQQREKNPTKNNRSFTGSFTYKAPNHKPPQRYNPIQASLNFKWVQFIQSQLKKVASLRKPKDCTETSLWSNLPVCTRRLWKEKRFKKHKTFFRTRTSTSWGLRGQGRGDNKHHNSRYNSRIPAEQEKHKLMTTIMSYVHGE